LLRPPFGEKVFCVSFLGKSDDQVGRIQDWLSRPIILFERNDTGSRLKLVGKVEDVTDGGGPEGIDRLGVIGDYHYPATFNLSNISA
jgi:hypothetical protein